MDRDQVITKAAEAYFEAFTGGEAAWTSVPAHGRPRFVHHAGAAVLAALRQMVACEEAAGATQGAAVLRHWLEALEPLVVPWEPGDAR
ncbi:hypothetical protein [Crenalkalicoccus roseus]|uniref:hypothetical protein n=1 Tax=Crenalkalicoccus roseus TaxID=1485588 RepID=UPI0010801155|nr:hypothetical protein [Crenalkalicoccus roseus]